MSERFAWIYDKKRQAKIWCADMWSRKAVLAIRTAITGITSRLTTIENAGYQTASDVSAAIASAIGGITELEYLVVSTLPATGARGVIYLVPHSHGTNDIYDEYIWINNSYEKIGNTDVDLSQYLQKTDISAWAKASTKPTYTAAEVGALPDTTAIPSATSDLTNDSGYITASDVPDASTATPAMDGTGAAGSSDDYARADHVHPSDTSKQDALSTAQLSAIDAVTASTSLTLTRTTNNFVNATDFSRLSAYKVSSNLVILVCNLKLSAQITGTSFVQIGTISGITPIRNFIQGIPGQNASGNMIALQVSTAGAISVYSPSSAASEWYRAVIPIIIA